MAVRVNMGCGNDYREGWVNVDVEKTVRADKHASFLEFPWPFEDGSVDEVLLSHVVEHVPTVMVEGRDALVVMLEELHRILAPGGKVVIKIPHWNRPARLTLGNPTHYRIISPYTFQGFSPGQLVQFKYASTARFHVESFTSKRHPPFADRMRVRGVGLTVHLRDRLLGPLMNWAPYEGTIILTRAPGDDEGADAPKAVAPTAGQ